MDHPISALPQNNVYSEVLSENNAQGVLREIEGLENERKLLVSRWVWELIQNARGTIGSQNELHISVQRSQDYLIFRHNGSKFREKEVAHLILHGSTKRSEKDIGRFGTGFITTHLLSKRIRVTGTLEPEAPFDFWLDRSGSTPAALQQQMERSWNAFRNSIQAVSYQVKAPFTTEFFYPIGPDVTEAVDGGIQALHAAAPYLFAFNPMLRRLEISNHGECTIIEVVDAPSETRHGIKTFRISINEDRNTLVALSEDTSTTVAMVLREENSSVSIITFDTIPRLFIAFPLNGMERFPAPATVNSEKFYPLQDRDGIPLAAGTNEKNETNQALLTKGFQQVVALFSHAAANNWGGISRAVRISGDENVRGADAGWLRTAVRKHVVEGLRKAEILKTINGNRIAPCKSWIPVNTENCKADQLWEVASLLRGAREKLPPRDDFLSWYESVTTWRKFAEYDETVWPELWSVADLAKHVAKFGTLTALQEDLGDQIQAEAWLGKLYDSIVAAAKPELFSSLAITPNQRGSLRPLAGLVKDGGIGDDLKYLADSFGDDLRSTLINKAVAPHIAFNSLPSYSDEQVLKDQLEKLRNTFKEPVTLEALTTNVALFRAVIQRSKFDKFDGFPVASMSNSQGKRAVLKIQTGTPHSRRWLAPVNAWPSSARPFAQVFSETVIVAEQYSEGVLDETWDVFVRNGFLLRDPIFKVTKQVSHFLPDEPLPEDEKDVRSETSFDQSNVAWATGDEHSIFERSRSSAERSIRLLRFFLEHALAVDTSAVKLHEAACDNGKCHRFYEAEWLVPLRNRSWISVGAKKNDAPSVNSFTILIGDNPDILSRLDEPAVAEMFRAIGVAPSELMLRTIKGSDDDRMSYIQSIATIAGAFSNDSNRVKALAKVLSEDAGMIPLIEERQANRERVARNQKLGELVEGVFAAVFGEAVQVKRTGPGHDYMLLNPEQDAGTLIEVESGLCRIYVEIKATAGNTVRMSQLQASEAIKNHEFYVLCVVPHATTDLAEATFKQQARFLTSIGELLKPAWDNFIQYDAACKLTQAPSDVAVEVGQHEIKFRIQEPAWNNGLDYNDAVTWFLAKLGSAPPTPSKQAHDEGAAS